MKKGSLEDYIWAISKVSFEDEIVRDLFYTIGKTYFKNNIGEYKENCFEDEAEYYLLMNTLGYLQRIREKVKNEKSDVKIFLELNKIYLQPN